MERETINKGRITFFFIILAEITTITNTKTVARTHNPKVLNTWDLDTNDERRVNKTG
jgi:hypothetical protein